jgi:hypothetical protein
MKFDRNLGVIKLSKKLEISQEAITLMKESSKYIDLKKKKKAPVLQRWQDILLTIRNVA